MDFFAHRRLGIIIISAENLFVVPGYFGGNRVLDELLKRCRPVASPYSRLLIAGTVWFVVGIALVIVACYWFSISAWPLNLVLAAGSLGMGFAVFSFGFSRIARKNIARIGTQSDFACLFAFQSWRSYLLILLMMVLGYTIRHLPIPKYIDAIIYFTMGSALAFGSSLYFQAFSGK
jgi:hypothetical protein